MFGPLWHEGRGNARYVMEQLVRHYAKGSKNEVTPAAIASGRGDEVTPEAPLASEISS